MRQNKLAVRVTHDVCCLYGHHIRQRWHQPRMAANPDSIKQGFFFLPIPRRRLKNLVSRDRLGRPVPRQPAHSPHPRQISCVLTSPPPLAALRDGVHLQPQPPSGQSRLYRITQMRNDGVHHRASACTGPGVLKAA